MTKTKISLKKAIRNKVVWSFLWCANFTARVLSFILIVPSLLLSYVFSWLHEMEISQQIREYEDDSRSNGR